MPTMTDRMPGKGTEPPKDSSGYPHCPYCMTCMCGYCVPWHDIARCRRGD